jgi:glutamate synthase (NADPH/NADH)
MMPLWQFFKQLFAQVTNPPIDPIREEIVMSLACPVGPEGNLLADPGASHCARLLIQHPVLTLNEMETLKADKSSGFKTAVIDMTFQVGSGPDGLLAVSMALFFNQCWVMNFFSHTFNLGT